MSGALAARLPSRGQWLAAREVLLGDSDRISLKAAARAGEMTLAELRRLHERSRERDPTDPAWVAEVDEVMALRDDVIHSEYLDGVWEMARPHREVVKTKRHTPDGIEKTTRSSTKRSLGALKELAKVRGGRPAGKQVNHNHTVRVLETDEALRRFKAAQRMKQVREEAKGSGLLIEGEAVPVTAGDFDG